MPFKTYDFIHVLLPFYLVYMPIKVATISVSVDVDECVWIAALNHRSNSARLFGATVCRLASITTFSFGTRIPKLLLRMNSIVYDFGENLELAKSLISILDLMTLMLLKYKFIINWSIFICFAVCTPAWNDFTFSKFLVTCETSAVDTH